MYDSQCAETPKLQQSRLVARIGRGELQKLGGAKGFVPQRKFHSCLGTVYGSCKNHRAEKTTKRSVLLSAEAASSRSTLVATTCELRRSAAREPVAITMSQKSFLQVS